MLVTLIVSALTFVYAVSFATPISAVIKLTHAQSDITDDPINADGTYDLFQQFNVPLIVLSVIFILLVALCYIMACQKRRNYYVTNYVSIIATAAYAVVLCIIIIVFTAICHTSFVNEIDWDTYRNEYTTYTYKDSQTVFWLGYVVALLTLVDAAALIYNMIWKIKLMKGEKQLLANGLVKEVA